MKNPPVITSEENNKPSLVSPSPDLVKKWQQELEKLAANATDTVKSRLALRNKKPFGMDDGVIYPGDMFPLGTPAQFIQRAAANRAPLTGTIRIAVVLVEFTDRPMTQTNQHFNDLFFSRNVRSNGSVREYFSEVSNNRVDIQGEVFGPYQLPMTSVQYANGESGIGATLPNASTMARDAVLAANPDINFSNYDNDGDGFVDGFVVLHAGRGADQTELVTDIWSHKWTLQGGAFAADGTNVFSYMTVPEDAQIGVCCHELGHLLFGFPDLYDTDNSSAGVGNWCLMGSGSWNGRIQGELPAHPCAWLKMEQGWINIINQTNNASVTINDVKDNYAAYRLWKDGAPGSEYFLIENRQQKGFDARLPGAGLLIWHIDETILTNTDETHYKIALKQADGNENLERYLNSGDTGDAYPGSSNNINFGTNTTPNSRSYADVDSCVAVTNISTVGSAIQATLQVRCGGKNLVKDVKDIKEMRKEFKDVKEFKEGKEGKEGKEIGKEFKDGKEIGEKPFIFDTPFGGRFGFQGGAEPFIDEQLRPDLQTSALSGEQDLKSTQGEMQKNAVNSKRLYDTKPKES